MSTESTSFRTAPHQASHEAAREAAESSGGSPAAPPAGPRGAARAGLGRALLQVGLQLSRVLVVGVVGGSVATSVGGGCLNRPVGTDQPRTTNLVVDAVQQTTVDQVDLLLMIDNSVSMTDKQLILANAVPDLVGRMVNPGCVNAQGVLTGNQPASPLDDCATDEAREFTPLTDINVAVITSSLGDAGANDPCQATSEPGFAANVDNAHLLGTLARAPADTSGLLSPFGFLEWRGGADQQGFSGGLAGLVTAAGQDGCGYEGQLEAWYRFLVDPDPYLMLARVDCPGSPAGRADCVQPQGRDQAILDQRAAFLRDGSLLAIIMLTDENDCSIRVGAQNWIAAAVRGTNGAPFREFAPTAACAADPNDACCHSCGQGAPANCPATESRPECIADAATGARTRLPVELDEPNVRCWNQKQRFGVDFLYPVERYINALTQPRLCLARADLNPNPPADPSEAGCRSDTELVNNPLYRKPDPTDMMGVRTQVTRNSDLVFLAGIIGVPWQLIQASSPADEDAADFPPDQLRFLTANQLSAPALPGNPAMISWDALRADPHMTESILPRPGLSPSTAQADADEIHGHERDIVGVNDLQYACIFDLVAPRECAGIDRGCDCNQVGDPMADELMNPLCQCRDGLCTTGQDGDYTTLQLRAKAFPGLRHLDVLEGYGALNGNSIVASICARNVDFANDAQDLGYRPAVDAIIDRLRDALSDRCVSRPLATTETEDPVDPLQPTATAPCSLVEVDPADTTCDCAAIDPAGTRKVPTELVASAVRQRAFDLGGLGCTTPECPTLCLCDLVQLGTEETAPGSGIPAPGTLEELRACQYDPNPPDSVQGWCYIDPARGLGNPDLVADCQANQRQILRFQPESLLRNRTTTFVACFGAAPEDTGIVIEVQ